MKSPLARNCVQPQTGNPLHPPSNDPYEPTLSDESIDLGSEIDSVSDPNTHPENKNPTKNGNLLEPENGPLTQAKNRSC